MAQKNFYKNLENHLFFEKKLLVDIYYKFFFRGKNEKNLNVLETFSNFFLKNNGYKFGFFSCCRLFSFRHNFSRSNLQFDSFLNYETIQNSKCLAAKKVLNGLKFLNCNKLFSCIIFLYPVKGGFWGYSLGLVGFIPRSQAEVILNRFELKKKNILPKFSFFLYKDHVLKTFFPVSFILKSIKINIYSSFRSYPFSANLNKKRSRFFGNDLNLIFLYKKTKIKKKNYENFFG